MAAERSKYVEEAVAAARSVILELHRVLGRYREHFVLIGGWVPELLYPGQHVGSMDVDLALDHVALAEPDYETIEDLLLEAGYRRGGQKYQYIRAMAVGRTEIEVHVDLLAGQYSGTGKKHRHQRVQDVLARKVRGGDLAFTLNKHVSLRGELPKGGMFTVDVRVAAEVPLIVMKSLALDQPLDDSQMRAQAEGVRSGRRTAARSEGSGQEQRDRPKGDIATKAAPPHAREEVDVRRTTGRSEAMTS